MAYKEKDPSMNDIYTLSAFYRTYKQYYEYYWVNKQNNSIKLDDIDEKIRQIYQTRKMGGVIDALCFYTNLSKDDLFNSDGTPKTLTELEVLEMIKEANYGKTND